MPFSRSQQKSKSTLSEPLLADTGVIVELRPSNEPEKISVDVMQSMVQFSSLLGLATGMIAPFVTIDVTLLIAYVCVKLDIGVPAARELFLVLDVLWALIVVALAVSAPYLLRGTIFEYFNVKHVPVKLQELVELRMALGTLVGVLISEVGMCFFLECGVWEYGGLAFGFCVVLYYCRSCFFYLNVDDFKELDAGKQERPTIQVV